MRRLPPLDTQPPARRPPVRPRVMLPYYRSPSIFDASRGPRVAHFARHNLIVKKGPRVGRALALLLWQRWLLNEILEERPSGLLRYRRGLVGVGRQNGKSIIGSTLALDHITQPTQGLEAYACAGDRLQARIVFGEARRQVIDSPTLSSMIKVYRDALEVPSTGNVFRVLSSDAKVAQGLSPSLVIFDEVHVQQNTDLWDAMTLGTGARQEALVLGITTAGADPESLCGRLYDYGKQVAKGEIDDPAFGFWWWEPHLNENDSVDLFDETGWEQANPSLVEGITIREDMEVAARQQTPSAFRRYRLNQWFRHGGEGWMDMAAWDQAEAPDTVTPIQEGDPVVLTFDGSVDQDATVLAATRPGDIPHHDVLKAWEPDERNEAWQVPRTEVHAAVDDAFARFDVIRLLGDPAWWRTELQEWQARYGERRVVEWPVTNARMGPAVAEAYKRIKDGQITHSGDPLLRRHVSNAVVKPLPGGMETIKKEKPRSVKRIDAAVTFVMGVDGVDRYATPVKSGTLTVF